MGELKRQWACGVAVCGAVLVLGACGGSETNLTADGDHGIRKCIQGGAASQSPGSLDLPNGIAAVANQARGQGGYFAGWTNAGTVGATGSPVFFLAFSDNAKADAALAAIRKANNSDSGLQNTGVPVGMQFGNLLVVSQQAIPADRQARIASCVKNADGASGQPVALVSAARLRQLADQQRQAARRKQDARAFNLAGTEWQFAAIECAESKLYDPASNGYLGYSVLVPDAENTTPAHRPFSATAALRIPRDLSDPTTDPPGGPGYVAFADGSNPWPRYELAHYATAADAQAALPKIRSELSATRAKFEGRDNALRGQASATQVGSTILESIGIGEGPKPRRVDSPLSDNPTRPYSEKNDLALLNRCLAKADQKTASLYAKASGQGGASSNGSDGPAKGLG